MFISDETYHHHQPINVPNAEAQAFLTLGPSVCWWVLTIINAARTNGLTCLPKHGKILDNKFLVTHPMTDQRCLTSVIVRRSALTVGPSSSSDEMMMRELMRLMRQP
jgi:hypothetical protein